MHDIQKMLKVSFAVKRGKMALMSCLLDQVSRFEEIK